MGLITSIFMEATVAYATPSKFENDCLGKFAEIMQPELTEADLDKILAEQKEILKSAADDEAKWAKRNKASAKQEAKWAKQIEREKKLLKKYRPLDNEKLPQHQAVEQTKAADASKLAKAGVQSRLIDIEPDVPFAMINGELVPIKEAVREITGSLPAPVEKPNAFTNMFYHPELPIYLEKMKALGFRLVVDSTLSHAGAGGVMDWDKRIIGVTPNAKWQVFVHEFEHLKFELFLRAVKSPKVISYIDKNAKIPDEVIAILGLHRTKWVNRLAQEDMPEGAIHETLAVSVQLEALGFRRFVPGSREYQNALYYRSYALSHQVTEVLNIHPSIRTLAQTRRLNRALIELRAIEHEKAFFAAAAVATGLAVHEGVGGDIQEIIYSEKESVMYVLDKFGKWSKVKFGSE